MWERASPHPFANILYQKLSFFAIVSLTFMKFCFKIYRYAGNFGKKRKNSFMKRLINFRPAVFAAVMLACGITAAYYVVMKNVLGAVAFSLIPLAIIVYRAVEFHFSEKSKIAVFSAVIVGLCLFFIAFTAFSVKTNRYISADLNGHDYNVRGRVVQTLATNRGEFIVLDNVELAGIYKGKTRYKVSAHVTGGARIELGDEVMFKARLLDRSVVYEGRFSAENVANGIKYTAALNASDVNVITNRKTIFQSVNVFLRDSLRNGLDGDEFAVAYAMLTGNSSEMQTETLSSYRSAGVAHIFAVSGLHIGFVAAVIGFILKKLNVKGVLAFLIVTVLALFYSGVCGFSASSLRAVVMCALCCGAAIRGNRYDALSSVSFAASVLLLISPVQLFCAGFRLSFGVVYGIILFAVPVARLLKFLPKKLALTFGTIIAAQISSIPISLACFGSFSVFAVAANLVFIPVAGVLFVTLLLAAITGGAFGISHITLFIPKYALKALNATITALDYKSFIIGGFTLGVFSAAYYAALIIPSGFLNLKRTLSVILSAICLVVCAVGTVAVNVVEYNSVKLYVIGSDSLCGALVSYKNKNMLVVNEARYRFSANRLKALADVTGVSSLDCVAVIDGKDELSLQVFTTRLKSAFAVDELYYYGEKRYDEEKITRRSFPDTECFALTSGITENSLGEFGYICDGRGLKLIVGDKVLTFFGRLDLGNVPKDVRTDVAIACNYTEVLNYRISAKRFVACRTDVNFPDGESEGILKIKLDN